MWLLEPVYGTLILRAFVGSLQSVACPASMLFVFDISFCFVHAYEQFEI
jgi:hypothetical protein